MYDNMCTILFSGKSTFWSILNVQKGLVTCTTTV